MENEVLLEKLENIEQYLLGLKTIFNVKELSKYTGFKCSYIYKLAHQRLIPYSKPSGKMLFFERVKNDNWLLTNYSPSNSEVEKNLVKKIMKE